MTESVSVIIPTTAEPARRESLRRAIDSARAQRDVATKLVVVVNGSRWDPKLVGDLEALPLQLIRLREANLPSAIRAGRLAVADSYFSFVDDDDVYLPDTLASRLAGLESARADFAVCNGLDAAGNPLIPDIRAVESDPLKALLTRNWLASCGGLYRSTTITGEFFEDLTKYFEWTVLAFRLLTGGKKVCFVDHAGFRVSDTESSTSKQRSMESVVNSAAVFEHMFARVPKNVRAGLSLKRASAYHDISSYCLLSGDLARAWRMHVSSLRMGGWRYLSYTRHLVRQTCRAWLGR